MYENNYYSNSEYNTKLAKMYTKPNAKRWSHNLSGKEIKVKMNSQEVLDKVEELGYKRNIRTLQRHIRLGLVSEPNKFQKYKLYSDRTPYEFFASIHLHSELRIPAENVKEARELALKFQEFEDFHHDDWLLVAVDSKGKAIYREKISDFGLSVLRSELKKFSSDEQLIDLAVLWWLMYQEGGLNMKKSFMGYHNLVKKK